MSRWILACCLTLPFVMLAAVHAEQAAHLAPGPRRPVAAVLVPASQRVLVANRNGLIALVDLKRAAVVAEFRVGRRLVDLALQADGRRAIALDEEAEEAILLDLAGDGLVVRQRISLPGRPASIALASHAPRAYVALLWNREVLELDLAADAVGGAPPTMPRRAVLPFPPRRQLLLPGGGHLLVADAFGGRLAVVELARLTVVRTLETDDHNLNGLSLTPDGKAVAVASQNLNEESPTMADAIDGNRLINNQVRTIPLAELLAPAGAPRSENVFRLGFAGSGAADPAGLLFTGDGELCVALAGVHELAFVRTESNAIRHASVGRRPVQVLSLPDGRILSVNMFGDSLTLVDPTAEQDSLTIALGPPGESHPRDRGEELFYDGKLSRDGWMSCHSCHTEGHSNGRLADTLGDDTYGTPKRVLSLLATADTGPWGWNGSQRDIFDQIEKSVTATMHGTPIGRAQSADLASFLYTLTAPPPRQPPRHEAADRAQLDRGRALFAQRGCVKCHVPPLTYTVLESFDVGLADEAGQRKFNPPSLVGVGQRERLFHDNRGTSLEDLFERHGHQLNEPLAREDLRALVRFLRSL